MIRVTGQISIDEREIKESFVRASGPGGQNVNKVSTAVELRFDVRNSPNLPEDVRARLVKLAGRRLTSEGVLVLTAEGYRSQLANRDDVLARLIELIRRASHAPRPRKPTKPSHGSKLRRLDSKSKRSTVKKLRRERPGTD